MGRRWNTLGQLFMTGRTEEARAMLVEHIERYHGNLTRVAHDLHIGRRHLYRHMHRENLWAEVDRARAKKIDWLVRTYRAFGVPMRGADHE